MIELSPKFKQALATGVTTSLYPLVKIYKGVKIDENLNDATEVINLSIKDVTISAEAYKGLLLSSPTVTSSANIIDNKFTISSVNVSISNAIYDGVIFSDEIQSILNGVCEVYYCANGIDNLNDCLHIYTGSIRRFSQSAETIKLTLEDFTQQLLSQQIPSSDVPDEIFYKEDDIGRPYPMVYGYVDKSPLIPRSLGVTDGGEVNQQLTKLHIDKRGQKIQGLWTIPNQEEYGNSILYDKNYLSSSSLAIYDNEFTPILQRLDNENTKGWSFYVDGITDPDDDDYRKIVLTGTSSEVYSFQQSNGFDTSASVKVRAESFIVENDFLGIPTRVYRPIEKVGFVVFNEDDGTSLDNGGTTSRNKIFGFTNYLAGQENAWKPFSQSQNLNWGTEACFGYDDDWGIGGEDGNETYTWWQPTACHQNDGPSAVESFIDDNHVSNVNKGFYPVDKIQNGLTSTGLYFCGRNLSGHRNDGNHTGYAAAKFILKNNVGSFPCSSKIIYDAEYHTFDDMVTGGASFLRGGVPSQFWTTDTIPEFKKDDFFKRFARDFIDGSGDDPDFPYIPNLEDGFEHFSYPTGVQSGTQDSVTVTEAFAESGTFNSTTAFSSYKFGIPQFEREDNHRGYCSTLLFNVFLLQDLVINEPLEKDFYADVAGRVLEGTDVAITQSQLILDDILKSELNFNGQTTFTEFDNWQNSFTLFEKQEAKQVFENLFKSSLIIPSYDTKGNFKFIPLHQVLSNQPFTTIKSIDVINYSFSLTKIDDVVNAVNVKYKKNYAKDRYDKETGYSLFDINGNEYQNLDEISAEVYADEDKRYNIGYYGLTNDAKLEFESDYIRDEDTAKKLQKRLLMWYANQHLISKIDLPVSYMNLEVGDYIAFDELLNNKKAFGYDYTVPQIRNGQLIYQVFFITKIQKSLDKVTIEAVQVHRGEYGEPNDGIIIDDTNEESTLSDGGDSSGNQNFQLPDPSDNPNFDENNIFDDEDVIIDQEPQFGIQLNGVNSFLQPNNLEVQYTVFSEFDTAWSYEVFIRQVVLPDNMNQFSDFDSETPPPTLSAGIPQGNLDANPYFNINVINVGTYGSVTITPKFSFPVGTLITCTLEVRAPDNQMYMETFYQVGFPLPPPSIFDLNQDGAVNVLDVVKLWTEILNTESNNLDYDLNGDGNLNIQDIVILINNILGESLDEEQQDEN